MDWVTEQFGRVVWAFSNEGAAFVQGLSAMVAAVATVVLVWITRRYAKLTDDMVRVSSSQLQASLYPTLEIEFEKANSASQVEIRIKNSGDVAAKLVCCVFGGKVNTVGLSCRSGEIRLEPVELKNLKSTILGKGQEVRVLVNLASPDVRESDWGAMLLLPLEYALRINCTDPRGVTKHSFVRRTDGRVEYHPDFTSSEQEVLD